MIGLVSKGDPALNHRYHQVRPQLRRLRASLRARAVVHLSLLVAVLVLLSATRQLESEVRSPLPVGPSVAYHEIFAAREMPGETPLGLDAVDVPRPFTLKRGQTLDGVLGELGLTRRQAYEVVEAMRDHVEVRRIRAGESGVAYFNPDEELVRLRLSLAGKGQVEIHRHGEGWSSGWHEAVRRVAERRAEGVLDGFLMTSLDEAGGDPAVAFGMSNVLQWDLDFNRDLRKGDRFAVLYEEVTLDGEPAGPGEILALEYENRGTVYEAFRWGEDGGYYDADGQPRRKMFLRSPLPFSRVTSHFSHRRFHPVLKVNRPHYGVDYGAPVGTPVRVTAHGTVTFKGFTKGGGHMVKVRHTNGYLSAYLHLSRYAKGLHKGQRVRQEEVIGYVGSTGLSTGPHLDYRVQKDGRWTDPLKLPNEPADPIPDDQLEDFFAHRDALRARLGLSTAPSSPAKSQLLAP